MTKMDKEEQATYEELKNSPEMKALDRTTKQGTFLAAHEKIFEMLEYLTKDIIKNFDGEVEAIKATEEKLTSLPAPGTREQEELNKDIECHLENIVALRKMFKIFKIDHLEESDDTV